MFLIKEPQEGGGGRARARKAYAVCVCAACAHARSGVMQRGTPRVKAPPLGGCDAARPCLGTTGYGVSQAHRVGEGWEREEGGVPDRPPRASRSGAPKKAAAGVSATGLWRGGLGEGRGGGPVSGEWPTWHACHARPQRPPPPNNGAQERQWQALAILVKTRTERVPPESFDLCRSLARHNTLSASSTSYWFAVVCWGGGEGGIWCTFCSAAPDKNNLPGGSCISVRRWRSRQKTKSLLADAPASGGGAAARARRGTPEKGKKDKRTNEKREPRKAHVALIGAAMKSTGNTPLDSAVGETPPS